MFIIAASERSTNLIKFSRPTLILIIISKYRNNKDTVARKVKKWHFPHNVSSWVCALSFPGPASEKTRKYANRVWIIRYSLCTHYNLPSHSYTYIPLQSVRARSNDTPVKIHTAIIIPWRRRATAGRWAQISQCALTECQFCRKIHTLLAAEPRRATQNIHSEKIETCSALIKKQFIGENWAIFILV